MLMHNLQDEQDVKNVPRVTIRLGFFSLMMIFCTLPLLVFYYTIESQFLLETQTNAICTRKGAKRTNLKNGCIGPDIPLSKLKDAAHERKVSINDVLMAIISSALKEYLVKIGDTNSERLNLLVPFSLRKQIIRGDDFTFNNEFAILPVPLRLIENFDEGLKDVKRDMDALKQSISPFGYYYTIMALVIFPRKLS